MAGDAVSDVRGSVGDPVDLKRPIQEATIIRALRPEDALQPLATLFARAADRSQFVSLLADYVRLLLGAAAVTLHERGDDQLRLAGFSSVAADPDARKQWLPSPEVTEKALAEKRSNQAQVLIGGRQHARLTVPFFPKGDTAICITAYLPPERVAFADPCFAMLHLTTQFLVQRELLSDSHENERAFQQATMLVEMFSRTSRADTFRRAVFSLATELEAFFGCQRVAIGTGTRHTCRVHAVSGVSSDEKRTLGFSQLAAAMKESIALGEVTVWPKQEGMVREAVVSANQDDLLHSFKAGRIVVVPMVDETTGFSGAMALLWAAGSPGVTPANYRLIAACRPHLTALVGFLKHSKPGPLRGGWLRFWRGGLVRRVTAIAVGAGLLVAMLLPVTYRVAADCRVQPVLSRTVAAPFENRLHRTYVKPGDEVAVGDILAELDGRETRVRLAEAIAARSAAVKKRDNAMVQEDPAALQMAQLEADRLALEVERLQYRSDNLLIRSPIDGVVLTGNLERSEGVPVTTGQKLFEIAPLETMVMEIAVPETEVRHVEPGMEVRLRLESDSSRVWESTLRLIHPISEVQEGENVFIGEAALDNDDKVLRPGMKGTVRILSDRQPIGWILFHRLWEFLRLKLW